MFTLKLIPDHYYLARKDSVFLKLLLRLKAEHNEMVLATRLEF